MAEHNIFTEDLMATGDVPMIDPLRCSIEPIIQARCGYSNRFNIVTRDTEGNVCSIANRALIHVQIQDIDGNDVDTEFTESENAGRYIVKYKAQEPSAYIVMVSIGEIAISNSPQNVETIDAQAEIMPVRVFETTRAREALTLAVHDNGEIAVVNNDHGKECRVVLFSADGDKLTEFGGEGTGESRLSYPLGVAFNGDQLLVTDNQDGYGCIKEFDIHGNYKRIVHQEKGIKFERMCTTEQRIACLTSSDDMEKKFIKLFSKQTYDLLTDIKLDVHSFRLPMFFAYDNNKYFVSFVGIHSVYVFDEIGCLLHRFGEEGNGKNQFVNPCGLTVFGADMLLVCDANNHRVHLRHQNGKFIRTFGRRGSDLGQMEVAYDVVVAPNGQVFVLEVGGNRVQVFR